ncbi:MAG: ABC transporter permease [Sulfolobales archaeon]
MTAYRSSKSRLKLIYLDFVRPVILSGRGVLGIAIIVSMILMATVGPELIPLDTVVKPQMKWCPPSLEHPLGCDYLGRDLFSLVVHGSREVFLIPFCATLIGVVVGLSIGLLAGYIGGLARRALTSVTDTWLTIPSFPVIFILAYALPKSPASIILLLTLFSWPGLARAVAAEVSSLKRRDYIEACVNLGLGRGYILFREIGPHILPFVAINFASVFVANMTSLIGIVLLGVAPLNPTNWGYLLNQMIFTYKGLLLANASVVIVLMILMLVFIKLGVVFFAQSLEEVFNPRLRRYE